MKSSVTKPATAVEQCQVKSRKKTAFFSGTPNFFGPPYFEAALVTSLRTHNNTNYIFEVVEGHPKWAISANVNNYF